MNRVPIIFSALCLLILATATLTAEPRPDLAMKRLGDIALREENIYKKLAEDPEFYSTEDLERHVKSLSDAYAAYLGDYPEDVEALILYGKLLRRLDQREPAFAVFLRADSLNPHLAVVKQQIGTYLAEEGKGKAALAFYLQAVELEPETAAYHFALGELLRQFRQEFIEDEVFSRDALEREMLKAFKKTALLAPDDFDAQLRLGETYYDLSSPDWKAALLHWNQLRKQTDSILHTQILDLHRAKVMGKLGRRAEALALLDAILLPGLQKSKQEVLEELSQL